MTGSVAQPRYPRLRFPQIFIGVSRRDQRAVVHSERSPTRGASMSRLTKVLIAAAAAAVAALAVVVLPAIGDAGTKGTEKGNPGVSTLAACLATHGLPGAPSTGPELKVWLGDKARNPDRVGAAMAACQQDVPDGGAPERDVQAMISCVRSHGIDAPTAPGDFKQWMGEQQQAGASKALQDALAACKVSLPQAKSGGSGARDCGAPPEKPASPADKRKQRARPSHSNGT
jgi:hypothetical protein